MLDIEGCFGNVVAILSAGYAEKSGVEKFQSIYAKFSTTSWAYLVDEDPNGTQTLKTDTDAAKRARIDRVIAMSIKKSDPTMILLSRQPLVGIKDWLHFFVEGDHGKVFHGSTFSQTLLNISYCI